MFGKTTKSSSRSNARSLVEVEAPSEPEISPSPVAAAPSPPRTLSTLSSELRVDGNLSGKCDLQLEGSVKGNVHVGRLIVGETGVVDGNVSADYLEIRGRVVGSVTGKQVRLIATAYLEGDITSEQLSIDIGAYFQGRVFQSRREPNPTAPVVTETVEVAVNRADMLPSSSPTTASPVSSQGQ